MKNRPIYYYNRSNKNNCTIYTCYKCLDDVTPSPSPTPSPTPSPSPSTSPTTVTVMVWPEL